jgi:hypothetical protein
VLEAIGGAHVDAWSELEASWSSGNQCQSCTVTCKVNLAHKLSYRYSSLADSDHGV